MPLMAYPHWVNTSGGIRQWHSLYGTSGANDDVRVVVEYGIEGGHVKNAC
jgi:hypothetical protein